MKIRKQIYEVNIKMLFFVHFRRGKPLFLHEKRYQLLEHQWVSHKFDHTNKRWVPHRDSI